MSDNHPGYASITLSDEDGNEVLDEDNNPIPGCGVLVLDPHYEQQLVGQATSDWRGTWIRGFVSGLIDKYVLPLGKDFNDGRFTPQETTPWMQHHHNPVILGIDCILCGRTYKHEDSLGRHYRSQHKNHTKIMEKW